MHDIAKLMSTPISSASYRSIPLTATLQDHALVELEDDDAFALINAYHRQGLAGASSSVYLRRGVHTLLCAALDELGPSYRFVIFDAFRSIACQKAIFAVYYDLILPGVDFNADLAWQKTKSMVPYPDDREGFQVLPHNSGGAVDLSLEYRGKVLDMGCPFDETNELARSDLFENAFDPQWGFSEGRWQTVRNNRRLLFNLLVKHGFTNHPLEWWHFNFGNEPWAAAMACRPLYDSAEGAVERLQHGGQSLVP